MAGLVLLLAIVIVGLATGCGGEALPQRITPDQKAFLHTTRINATVGVEDYGEAPAYSEALDKELVKTHLFARVDYLTNFTTPPDLVAHVEETIHGSAAIPVNFLISFGIIPSTSDEDHGYSFSLSRPGAAALRVPIQFEDRGPTPLGWCALFVSLSPNQTLKDADNHPRFIESFAWEIAKKEMS